MSKKGAEFTGLDLQRFAAAHDVVMGDVEDGKPRGHWCGCFVCEILRGEHDDKLWKLID